MEQRRLRLGDIVDDYCPRERRVTNHAVVAMVEEGVKQTRCTTCDAEHAYKGGKAPRRRKKETTDALYKEVLAGITDTDAAPVLTVPVPSPAPVVVSSEPSAPVHAAAGADTFADEPVPESIAAVEDGPVHRQLIRATLPRIEGQKEERRAPEFTIRQPGAGGRPNGGFRGGGPRPRGGQGQGQGQGQHGDRQPGGGRFAGARTNSNQGRGGAGRGPGGGFRAAQPHSRTGGGGRKRSR